YVGLTPTVGILLAFIVAGIALKAAFLWLAMRQVGFTVADVTKDLRLDLVRAVLAARWRHFSSRAVGQFANAISGEAIRAASAYRDACSMMGAILQMIVYLVVAVVIAWHVSLIAVAVGVVFVFVLRRFVDTSRDAGRDQTRLTRSLTGRLVDALRGIKAVKAMAKENLFWPLLEREAEGLNEAQRRQVIASEGLKLFQEPLVTLALAAGLYGALTMSSLPFGSVLLLAFIFYRLLRYMNTIQMRYQTLAIGESAFESLRESVDQARAEVEVNVGDRVPGPLRREIRFDSVSFSYDDEPVVSDVSLTIPAGSFVTFSGASGAGKTTLVDMIAGLHQPVEGRIWVDDVPLTDLKLRAWREEIGYVPQEPLLFNDTILKNVTLGDDRFSTEQVKAALEAAGAWEFIEKRQLALDEPVGEAGARLSGGQRQRIAIARALVGKPTLLILDEVTTALDPVTEAEICETLLELRRTVTIVAISHQSAVLNAADISYVVERGRVRRRPAPRDAVAASL
ncbi:MAG: ABC transporter ATP-binding protein, partial [Longimicrobiales bacterium]